ncbi:recombinase family protein [Ruegeria sp.]|uniref:recombinase family protein n=1 Tax=Ruegeria sp. TaxID=1879320 RepID=UPI003C79EB1A
MKWLIAGSSWTARCGAPCQPSQSISPGHTGQARASLGFSDATYPLRHIHPEKLGGGVGAGFQLTRCPAGSLRSLCCQPKHEGWELLPNHYDDGGISGGHLERPALQRLMRAVDDKHVDQIVVYKIDRLTRSLADFAKLVERLDAADASFVSVTQSFNTSTSMGRLTLNVLLSFAQFEREVTAERIWDKIAASKRKACGWAGMFRLDIRLTAGRLKSTTRRLRPSERSFISIWNIRVFLT